jgi:hypothetical protein
LAPELAVIIAALIAIEIKILRIIFFFPANILRIWFEVVSGQWRSLPGARR